MKRNKVYEIIDGERAYQDLKWTEGNRENGIPDEDKSVAEWIIYMEFHLQKAKQMIYNLNQKEALAEIRKVTALGVRAMEVHGCPERIIDAVKELKELLEKEVIKIHDGCCGDGSCNSGCCGDGSCNSGCCGEGDGC